MDVMMHGSPMIAHPNMLCSECQGEGRGVWYKCTTCNDFLLCSECENRGLHDHHIMVRISAAKLPSTVNNSTAEQQHHPHHHNYQHAYNRR